MRQTTHPFLQIDNGYKSTPIRIQRSLQIPSFKQKCQYNFY